MVSNKIKIIYIVGYGRSGSTLLNIILGSSKKTFSVGELCKIHHWIWKIPTYTGYKPKSDYICDCGKDVKKCIFWSDVIKNTDSNYYKFIWGKKDIFNVANYLYNPFSKMNFNLYNDNIFYSNILSTAQKFKNKNVDIIIDSSKDIRRLITLSQVKNLDIIAIHLVRDGRGVINSMHKSKVNGIKTYTHWLIFNVLTSRFLKKKFPKSKQIKISYDKFAQNPNKYIKLINRKFKTEINEKNYIKAINKEEFHNFAGNIMRKRNVQGIKYDQSWKNRFNSFQKILYNILTYIPNKLWVYNSKYK